MRVLLAGADPYEDDQLGGLRLTKDGLRRRDRLVIRTVRAAKCPARDRLAGATRESGGHGLDSRDDDREGPQKLTRSPVRMRGLLQGTARMACPTTDGSRGLRVQRWTRVSA